MLAFEEALARILAKVPAPRGETISLSDAPGRVLADQVRSPIDLPNFDNSAMDGYAVRAADVASAKPASPACLRLAGKVAAGEVFAVEVAAGTCVRLFTGSPLPPGANAVVTSGGVSVGELDFLKRAFQQIGGELAFWKVAIKPGRPFVFGRLRGKLLFGLPGNPVSAFVTFLLLVRPALLRWQGATDVSLPAHPGVLVEPLANHGERRHFMRVKVDPTGKIHSTGIQASHVLSSLAAANGLVDVPAHTTLVAGSAVTVLRWDYC
jgi:molybdopterin biosynthesis enzyme